MNSTTVAAQIIAATAGRWFVCEFIKKNGTRRVMIARIGVRRYVTGAGLKFNPAERGLAVVWDAAARGYRMINLNTLLSLRCGSLQWSVSTPSEQPRAIEDRPVDLPRAFNSCDKCSRQFPGATGATDFVNHLCVPVSELKQELAKLEEQRDYLRMRMESAESYGSRRFGGLTPMKCRHKLARIQERQIELREQLASLEEGLNRAA